MYQSQIPTVATEWEESHQVYLKYFLLTKIFFEPIIFRKKDVILGSHNPLCEYQHPPSAAAQSQSTATSASANSNNYTTINYNHNNQVSTRALELSSYLREVSHALAG